MNEFKQHLRSVLEKHISKDAANDAVFEILKEFAGSNVYISIPFQERNEKIVSLSQTGISTKKLAHEFSLTVRSIEQIIKNFK